MNVTFFTLLLMHPAEHAAGSLPHIANAHETRLRILLLQMGLPFYWVVQSGMKIRSHGKKFVE
jgi:hypothetical protein